MEGPELDEEPYKKIVPTKKSENKARNYNLPEFSLQVDLDFIVVTVPVLVGIRLFLRQHARHKTAFFKGRVA